VKSIIGQINTATVFIPVSHADWNFMRDEIRLEIDHRIWGQVVHQIRMALK